MFELPVFLLILGLFFYLEESVSPKPNLVRAARFVVAMVEACLSMALAS